MPALRAAVRGDRAAAGAGARAHGAPRRAGRSRAAAGAELAVRRAAAGAAAAGAARGRATTSMSTRRSSCSRCCSRSWGCRCCARRRPGSPPRPRMCWRSSRRRYRAAADRARLPRARQAQIDLHRQAAGADQSAHRPHPHLLSARRWRRPAGSPPPIPTCRTFRSAVPRAGASARPSSRRRGIVLLAADYSQIELRIMAHLSGDEGLLRRLRGGSRRPPGDGGGGLRRAAGGSDGRPAAAAKTINFGLIYGMSPFGLARQLGIDRGAAQSYVERYFQRYPGRAALHGRDAQAGARARLCRDGVRPAAVPAGHPLRQRADCGSTRSAAPSTRRCRAPRPTSSSAR